jgi:hypothetical protein
VVKTEQQTANDFDVVSTEVRKTVHGVDEKIKSVDDVRNAARNTGAKDIDGTK